MKSALESRGDAQGRHKAAVRDEVLLDAVRVHVADHARLPRHHFRRPFPPAHTKFRAEKRRENVGPMKYVWVSNVYTHDRPRRCVLLLLTAVSQAAKRRPNISQDFHWVKTLSLVLFAYPKSFAR